MTSTSFNTGYSLARNSSKVIQPPGGQTADIFGSRSGGSLSSSSSQAGSDVASARMYMEADQQCVVGGQPMVMPQVANINGQMVASESVESSVQSGNIAINNGQEGIVQQQMMQQQQQGPMSIQRQKLIQFQQMQQPLPLRSPKKTIPVIRRNPITGEVYENPTMCQQMPVRVRQPPGGRSAGIF